MKKILSIIVCCLFVFNAHAFDLFDPDARIQQGVDVFELSDGFADIYEQLSTVNWNGKSINNALESIESVAPGFSIAATDRRVVIVQNDKIIGNWPRPEDNNWRDFGQITTALILKMKEVGAQNLNNDAEIYSAAVPAIVRSVDASGKYVLSASEAVKNDGRILTSAGIDGARDEFGNLRVTGVIKGGVADNAGIKDGDLILGINGVNLPDMDDGELASIMSGFNSGTLKLRVASENSDKVKNVILRRATVILTDADVIVKGDVLELVVYNITNDAVAIVNDALNKYKPSGIVLDLRAAAGDDAMAMAKIAGLFMGRVPVLRIADTAKEEVEIIPGGDAVIDAKIPVAVLISNATTGTAEGLAAAFYEHGRGALIGTPSANAAHLATKLNLKNGGQIEVFNRALKTGKGAKLTDRGVFPIVCITNIRNAQQRDAFFVNVINGDFNAQDFNALDDADLALARRGCPNFVSGEDEDNMSAAVAATVLSDKKVYGELTRK